MYLYRIYCEWQVVPQNELETFEWMVEVKYLESLVAADKYIDKVKKWMQVDFPNPIFRIDESEISVEIVGPFEGASQAGEFTDLLIEAERELKKDE